MKKPMENLHGPSYLQHCESSLKFYQNSSYPQISEQRFWEKQIAMMQKEISWEQLMTAKALASRYGHYWADYQAPEGKKVKLRDIYNYAFQLEGDSDLPVGILGPEVDEKGRIVHTTGSGRLSWIVNPNGETKLIVSRPGNITCLEADIFLQTKGPWRGRNLATVQAKAEYFARHVDSLEYAMTALMLPEDVAVATKVVHQECPEMRAELEAELRTIRIRNEIQQKAARASK